MKPIKDFCDKHRVSLDWLMSGDLKGLLRMKQWEKEDRGMTPDEQRAEILGLLRSLPLGIQKLAIENIRRIAEGSIDA
jgi:hypothetical protein